MIYFIWAPPRQGKTFYATYLVLLQLLKGNKKVFTNYPVIYEIPLGLRARFKNFLIKWNNRICVYLDKKSGLLFLKNRFTVRTLIKTKSLSSYVWKPEYAKAGITDSSIFIDEAYRDYSSRNFKSFDVDTHTFFATNGHDNNDFYLLTQHPNRLDLIIREMANIFYHVKKYTFPWSDNPLLFRIEGFLTQEDFLKRTDDSVYTREYLTPKQSVKTAYDTHHYRTKRKPIVFKSWIDLI